MCVRLAMSICVAIALAGAAFSPIIRPYDLTPPPQATDEPALDVTKGVTDTLALFSANERYPFDVAPRYRVTSPNFAVTPAMATAQLLPGWHQATNPGHALPASGASPLLLHCQLII